MGTVASRAYLELGSVLLEKVLVLPHRLLKLVNMALEAVPCEAVARQAVRGHLSF